MTAAVVTAVLNLALLFAPHSWFRELSDGPLALELPVPDTLDPWAAAFPALAVALTFGARVPILLLLAGMATAGSCKIDPDRRNTPQGSARNI